MLAMPVVRASLSLDLMNALFSFSFFRPSVRRACVCPFSYNISGHDLITLSKVVIFSLSFGSLRDVLVF
jgi:hypothetical protein